MTLFLLIMSAVLMIASTVASVMAWFEYRKYRTDVQLAIVLVFCTLSLIWIHDTKHYIKDYKQEQSE